ncbi:FMN-binding glutamate synthase family protein [Luteimonas sp. MC1750]|uniref:FMN-binding glutamate synthase family protein n=1 Tax=Luteimonas sp. MC1750 TaxID=2799326 RepID=UPI0018F07425|nr:FMN-binding glutamate synthase family protein [Luteimonas sp. MC1750]MBJ6984186.1 FMN-binding glutamate synthase family protein [Luteimonas sp. MC1750]QQO07026.1 FMN-binding glutamate synthase family protein [Luteimonas sp. MC1750]
MTYRYTAWFACIAICLLGIVLALTWSSGWWWVAAVAGALSLLGLLDVSQRISTLRQLYPVLIHFRYGLESVGPEIRQYFIERETEEVPFSREQRALVYQRAKRVQDTVPFGTIHDVYGNDYEWINHSLVPTHLAGHDFRTTVGAGGAAPYDASVFNISAMSFGSLSANAVRALNLGAKRGGFYHDTGEGSISPYHREYGGDLVWEIGSGYFGCRDAEGRFDPERFAANAADPQVKMIEIKLSQGAKPGHGGMLPGAKVTPEIALTRGVPVGVDCNSPAQHSAFGTPVGLLEFVAGLRGLAGGKPVGFKLAIGHPWEWFGVAKAMRETGILPDFIVVDGAEGGTGAAPVEFVNHIGVPLQEALMLVHNTLVGLDLRDKIRVGAAGKITSAFDIARTLAMGADFCNAGRAFMFSLGCIQARSCHNDRCPTGIATQDPRRWKHLDVQDKGERVANYHRNTMVALRDLLCASGLSSPAELGPEHIVRRVSQMHVSSLASIYHFLQPGELLAGAVPERHAVFKTFWDVARADTFAPPSRVLEMRTSKSR